MKVNYKPTFICLLAIISSSCNSALSLPLSDLTLYDATVQTHTSQEEIRFLNHTWKGDDLKAALCPDNHIYDNWDVDVKCSDSDGVYLSIGHCLTYHVNKHGKHFLYEFKCPYFQLEGHQVTDFEPGFIKLPHNISELNDYMCGPMNRKGFLCEECIDNFSVSMTSIGNKCSNCTDVWYGTPLYITIELVPITAFYLFILVFQIHVTSPPMVSFIFYSQMIMFNLTVDRPPPLEKVIPQHERSFWFNLNLFIYSPWNLDFLRYVVPPFCVFEGLSVKHMAVLSYVPVLYPLFLILLTWVCIKLYDRGFRPIVCIVVTFHKCLVKLKQDWGDKRDVMDVFSAFFLLSYSRLLHQSSLFLVRDKVSNIHDKNGVWGIKYVMNYDYNITYGSPEYIAVAVVSLLIIFVFSVLPALLLVLYPFKIIRACLSKCQLDALCLSAFMDKFHGCYRNGLNGGRDMRSFAGLYFFIRYILFLYYPSQLYKIHFSFGSYLVLLFLSVTILIALARPYKESYMNVFDTVILAHFTFISKIQTDDYFKGMVTQIFIMSLLPAFVLGIYLLYVKIYKVYNFKCCRKWQTKFVRNYLHQITIDDVNFGQVNSNSARSNEIQSLLAPTTDSSGE